MEALIVGYVKEIEELRCFLIRNFYREFSRLICNDLFIVVKRL